MHRNDFDIIHVHSYRTYQNVKIRQLSLGTGVPYILSAHGSVPNIVRMKLAKRLFDELVGKEVLTDAAGLVAVSKAEVRQYEAAGVPPSKIRVISNGIDSKQYSPLPTRGKFLRLHGLDGKKIVTYLGRINSRKGLDTLLESISKLVEIRDDLALVLVGPDDGYRGQVERLVKRLSITKEVLFTGLITLPEKLAVLVDSDVIVYPGPFEIFGLVPFEALLCERPIIVADDSGCGEIVASAGAGLTVPVGNPNRLQAAIQYVLENPESIAAMTKRGKEYVLQRMNWSQIAIETEHLYSDAIAGAMRSSKS